VLGWLVATLIRICLGSATVAGLTAAGIVAPVVQASIDPSLMVLAIGAGSLMQPCERLRLLDVQGVFRLSLAGHLPFVDADGNAGRRVRTDFRS
jgi:hypothetical protein